jgi:hypothetical protein
LQEWARFHPVEVNHVGTDNEPGDILVIWKNSNGNDFRIVIECRDKQVRAGRKPITDDLTKAFRTRQADAAVYVSKTNAGLASTEIGDFFDGTCAAGPWVACIDDHLLIALRWLHLQHRAQQQGRAIDTGSIAAQVVRMRTSLKKITNINTYATDVQDGAEKIRSEAIGLREDMNDALAEIQSALDKPDDD